jgi:hypothetical protein
MLRRYIRAKWSDSRVTASITLHTEPSNTGLEVLEIADMLWETKKFKDVEVYETHSGRLVWSCKP